MRNKDFDNLVSSIRQAGRIRRGELKASRVRTIAPVDVKAIRRQLDKSPDDLINDLIANNEAFRTLLAESAASPRKPMRFSKSKNSKHLKKRK